MLNSFINFAKSRNTRTTVARIRTISTPKYVKGIGSWWGDLGGAIMRGLGSLLNILQTWEWRDIWGAIVAAASFLWNFNWNQTDAESEAIIRQSVLRISGLLGQGFGATLGRIVCGAVPLAAIIKLNPNMGYAIAKEVTEELISDLASELKQIAFSIAANLGRATLAWLFQNVRRFFKGSDREFEEKLRKSGMPASKIQQKIADRNKPFIFRKVVTDWIESIPNDVVRNFVEESYEEFGSSCIEAGYVVAGAVDRYRAEQSQGDGQGYVEVTFDNNGNPKVTVVNP